MADRPILFSSPMVRALLDGRKSQTRRVLSNDRFASLFNGQWDDSYVLDPGNQSWRDDEVRYRVGDRLYVREAWRTGGQHDHIAPRDLPKEWAGSIGYIADEAPNTISRTGKFRQGMHMPRWASRLTLIVTDVRVQRLQEISEADARAEGISPLPAGRYYCGEDEEGPITAKSAITAFGWLWNGINGERPGCHWQDNPWVVAVTFTVHRQNIDQMAEVA